MADRPVIARARRYLTAAIETCGRRRVVALQALQVLGAVLEATVLALLVPLIQMLAGETARIPVVDRPVDTTVAISALVVTVVLRSLVQWWSATLGSTIRIRTSDALRLRALQGVLDAEWSYLVRRRRSDIVQATTTEMERAEAALLLLLRMGVDGCLVAATAVVAILISPLVGGLAVLCLLAVAAVGRRSIRHSIGLGMESTRRTALFGATVTDSLASLRLIRAHDAAAAWTTLLQRAAAQGRQTQHRFVEITAGIQAALSSAGVAAALGLVLLGRERGLGVAELIALAVVTVRLLTAARSLLQTAQMFANNAPGIDVVTSLIAETSVHREVTRRPPVAAAPPGVLVELRDLTAGYGEEPAIRNLDLTVPADGFVAVTGPSGSGKSTLLDVLLGLLPPTSGELRLNAAPTSPSAWRAQVGYVPQQTVLVPGTVRENLLWSATGEPTDDDLWDALHAADLDAVIRRLPAALDTALGDQAALSGGEQQRLCIARAVVRRPQLLVLDEATSALDAATEQRVIDRLLARPGAIVLATHRATLWDRASQVISLA